MILFKIMQTYPFQVFRFKIYNPITTLIGKLGDRKRGVQTQNIVELEKLGLDPNVGSRCETISYKKLRMSLKFAKEQNFETFIDIGCGLGRGLLVAYEVGFKNIYGVDISSELISACKRNLAKTNNSVSLFCCDVDKFDIPKGKLVIYLFNPFGQQRMASLVKKLSKRSSECLVIYHTPKHTSVFKEKWKIREVVWKHFGLYNEQVNFYLIPASTRN